jgi:type IV pilus assembly protein PilW
MRRQRGMSIAELMVAVVIGTLLSLLAVTLLVAASSSYIAHTEAASLDDAGRFALSVIERAARQTGFADWERGDAAGGPDPAAPAPIMGLDAASLSSDSAAINDPRPAAVNGSDVLALRFAGSGSADGDGSATTCAGFSVGAGQDGWSIFYVGNSARGEPELRCKYRGANGWSAEAVVAGVDSFQVLYGLDTDAAPDGQANRYVTANAINALGAAHWKRVAGIKVSMVLHGAQRSKGIGAPAVYHLFGPAYGAAAGADLGTRISKADIDPALRDRVRRTFTATILLRNQAR